MEGRLGRRTVVPMAVSVVAFVVALVFAPAGAVVGTQLGTRDRLITSIDRRLSAGA